LHSRSGEALSAFERKTSIALRSVAIVGAGLLLVACGRLVYLNLAPAPRVVIPSARPGYPAILESVAAQSSISSAEAARALDPAVILEELRRKHSAGTLVIADVMTPFSFIELPREAVRPGATPAQIAYLPFSDIGNYWTLFCGRDLEPLLNQRFVAVARLHEEPLKEFPETHGLGPLMRIIALVPFGPGPQGRSPLLFAYPCPA
jgi:hypothetical protein